MIQVYQRTTGSAFIGVLRASTNQATCLKTSALKVPNNICIDMDDEFVWDEWIENFWQFA